MRVGSRSIRPCVAASSDADLPSCLQRATACGTVVRTSHPHVAGTRCGVFDRVRVTWRVTGRVTEGDPGYYRAVLVVV